MKFKLKMWSRFQTWGSLEFNWCTESLLSSSVLAQPTFAGIESDRRIFDACPPSFHLSLNCIKIRLESDTYY